jgi:hypothetical protein
LLRVFIAAVCLMLAGCWDTPFDRIRVVSPVPYRQARADTVPILIRLPSEPRFHEAEVRLDGEPVDLAGYVRRRWWDGKEADYIATMPAAELAAGWHSLQFRFSSPQVDPVTGESPASHEVFEVATRFRYKPRVGRLVVKVLDAQGRPRHARVGVQNMNGDPFHIGDKNHSRTDPSKRDKRRNSFFVIDGIGQARIPPGRYRLIISGGIRDDVVVRTTQVRRKRTVEVTLPRVIDTPGEVTSDLHVHTGWSSDAFITDYPRFRGLVAADVDVAVITDHNRARDARPALELLGLAGEVELVTGTERHVGSFNPSLGHANVFPLAQRTRMQSSRAVNVGQAVAEFRSLEPWPGFTGKTLLQLNHPRGIQFWPHKAHRPKAHAPFQALSFDPARPLGRQDDPRLMAPDAETGLSFLDMDAIEILNRFTIKGWRHTRRDWFGLMNQGWFPTGTGNSDSHSTELERIGFPVNLVKVRDPHRFEVGEFVESVRAGSVRVSSGPLVDIRVAADALGSIDFKGPGERIDGPVDHVVVDVRVRAAPWVPVPEVRLIVDGAVVHRVRLPPERVGPDAPIERAAFRWRLPISGDTWVLAEAGWPLDSNERPDSGVYPEVARGHVPIGFTNPVRIEAEGDRTWTPRLDPEVFLPSSVW